MSQLCFKGTRSLGNPWKELPCLPYSLCLSLQDTLFFLATFIFLFTPRHHLYYPTPWLENSQSSAMLQKYEDILHLAAFERHSATYGVLFLIF